jgi:hypothetical protein
MLNGKTIKQEVTLKGVEHRGSKRGVGNKYIYTIKKTIKPRGKTDLSFLIGCSASEYND